MTKHPSRRWYGALLTIALFTTPLLMIEYYQWRGFDSAMIEAGLTLSTVFFEIIILAKLDREYQMGFFHREK